MSLLGTRRSAPAPLHPSERRSWVSGEGAQLAVYEYGPEPGPGVPEVLLVHGYPDDHTVFAGVIPLLAEDHHVIAYDTRDAGLSTVQETALANFRLPLLVEDLYAVLKAASAGPVQLVGHDWGSIQGWAAARDPRAPSRLSRYLSISGPDLQHFRGWFARRLRVPARWPDVAQQCLRSSYVAGFQIPVLPELFFSTVGARLYERTQGRPAGRNPQRGLALYRANLAARGTSALQGAVQIPVDVMVPLRDPFLSPALNQGVEEFAPRVRFTAVDAGHWWPASHAADLAARIREGSPELIRT
ncbi:alpha/beta fold hydrolase [Arthrobacter sp. 7Tela_A1]|uniref:alpha/beta fold hydrolase n=1 Tax=Arthrobacter sp. 7Tela_A1 TaxID=3093745 RepID=UPI003BB6D70C